MLPADGGDLGQNLSRPLGRNAARLTHTKAPNRGVATVRRAAMPCFSSLREGLIQVLDQVVHVFDADRQAYQAVREAHFLAELERHAGVRHRRGVPDETLHAAE